MDMRELRSLAPAMHSTIPSIIAASERGVCGSGKFYNLFQTLRMAAFGGRPRRVGVALAAAVAAAASGGRFARAFVVAGGGGRVGGQAALRMAPESDTRGLVQPPEFPTSGAVDADEESYWSAIFSSGLEGEVSMVDAFSCPSTQVLEFLVPGEGDDPTLCSDAAWMSVQLALKFLALPYDVKHAPDEDSPLLNIGTESYMDPAECLSVLESRYVLVDIVQTVAGTLTPIRAVRDAFMALLLAKDAAAMQRGRKELGVELGKIDFRLSQRNEAGPFVEGPDLTMGDFELACTLYHMRIALNYFRNWSLPTKFEQLTRYAAEMHDMEVFKQIAPTPEAIIRRYEDMGVKVAAAKSA